MFNVGMILRPKNRAIGSTTLAIILNVEFSHASVLYFSTDMLSVESHMHETLIELYYEIVSETLCE